MLHLLHQFAEFGKLSISEAVFPALGRTMEHVSLSGVRHPITDDPHASAFSFAAGCKPVVYVIDGACQAEKSDELRLTPRALQHLRRLKPCAVTP